MDQYSRRVLAWSLAATRDARVTCEVLDAALRRGRADAGLIFHSDRGSEFMGRRSAGPGRARRAAEQTREARLGTTRIWSRSSTRSRPT